MVKKGSLAGGITCLILGILIGGAGGYFYTLTQQGHSDCTSGLGQFGQYLDPELNMNCSNVTNIYFASFAGIIVGIILFLIGIIATIVGAVGSDRSKQTSRMEVSEKQSSLPSQGSQTSSDISNMIYCRYCGELRPTRDESCSLCGRSAITSSTGMKQCAVCEASMSEDSIYCANCGARFQVSVHGSITGNSSNVDGESFLTFEASKAGIRIQYPSSWSKQVEQNEVTFSPPESKYGGKKSSNVWVAVDHTNKNSLDEYVQERIETIKNEYEDVKLLESGNSVTLSGRPAYKLVYIRRSSDTRFLAKRMEVGTIVDKKFKIVNAGSQTKYYSEILPTLERMISSFELMD